MIMGRRDMPKRPIEVGGTMITRISARNYRSLANISVDLEPLTVLVGRNGAGKSNLVDVLRFVRDAVNRGLDTSIMERHGMSSLRRWSGKGRPYDVTVGIELREDSWSGGYTFTLGSERRGEYKVKREKAEFHSDESVLLESKDGRWVHEPELGDIRSVMPKFGLKVNPTALSLPLYGMFSQVGRVYDYLSKMSFYSIFPNSLREPQKPTNPYPLDEFGENLASVLRKMKQDKARTLPMLIEALGEVVDGLEDYSVTQIGGYLVTRLRHTASKGETESPSFELAQESDGTLRMLGILAAIYQQPPRSLIVVEEPELTIHPGALGVLCDVLSEASTRSQVVITSHSADLISKFNVHALRVVEKREDRTVVSKVSEKQIAAVEEMLFTTGDLLRIEGLEGSA